MILIFALIIALIISVIMLRYWKISSQILRIISGLLCIAAVIASIGILFSDMYASAQTYMSLKDTSGNVFDVKLTRTDIIIKKDYTYHVYSMTIPPYRGYTLYNESIHRMALGRELLVKTLLLLPLILLIFIVFGEQNSIANVMHIERMRLRHRDKMYIDHSVAAVMKSLRENIERLKTRRDEFDKVNEQINMLEQRVRDDETKQYLQGLKEEYRTIMDDSQFKTAFSAQLARCGDYVEEAILRLDFNDISIAVSVFLAGLKADLIKMTGAEHTLRELVKTAHEQHMIDYDLMYNLNWLVNLDHDYLRHKQDIFPDIARIRKTFSDYNRNILHTGKNNDRINRKEDR